MNYKGLKIGLIGYGSIGKQLHNMLLECDVPEKNIYVFADDIPLNDANNRFKFQDFKLEIFKDLHFIPALGYLSKNLKYNILNYLIEMEYNIFTFVHPSAYISKFAQIGKGVIIYPLSNIDQGTIIEDGVIILNSTTIPHDCRIGKCTYISPAVAMSGYVNIGELSFIGTGVTISNNVNVGINCTVAIATCLTKDINDNSFVIGNPFQYKTNIELK